MVLSASPRRMFAKKSADSQCGSFSPSFRRACQTVFDGQNALIFCFPPRQTKIRRANSEAPLPAGANSVASAHRQRPLPAGQGSVISPPVRSFLPRKSVKGNTSTFPLHILPPEKTAEQRTIGKNKRQTSVFNAGAAIPCSAGARGDARAEAQGAEAQPAVPPAAVFGSASGWRFYDAAQCAPVLRHCHFRGSQPRPACSPRLASFREERGFRPFFIAGACLSRCGREDWKKGE